MIRRYFGFFLDALGLLRAGGTLGPILLQCPPYFTDEDSHELRRNLRWLRRCREPMADYDLGVEFRHRSWFGPTIFDAAAGFQSDEGLPLVAVDDPQVSHASVRPVVCSTG